MSAAWEPVTEWGAIGELAAYEERAKLANADVEHTYAVDERPGEVWPMREFRIMRGPALR